MRQITIILAALALMGSQIACCAIPVRRVPDIELPDVDIEIPDIDIEVPTFEAGEMQDVSKEISLAGAELATIEVKFGAGKLSVETGAAGQRFSGRFRYNVERWEPEVTYEGDVLTIRQGGTEEDWGIPTGDVHNEWELAFPPDVPLEMDFKVGAGQGALNLTGLQLEGLDIDIGAGDFDVRFDEPNQARMSRLTLDTGASRLEMTGIGNAGPARMTVQGGVGDITLDFTGNWPTDWNNTHSAEVEITTGVGSVTLNLPDDVGVRVETKGGLTDVDVSGFRRTGDAYVNDAFGETETELHIQVTTGIGSLRLLEVSN